jgi:hypothetical protein
VYKPQEAAESIIRNENSVLLPLLSLILAELNAICRPTPVAVRSEAWVCGSSLDRVAGSKPAGSWMSVCFVCGQVEVSATSQLLVQRSRTECGMSK